MLCGACECDVSKVILPRISQLFGLPSSCEGFPMATYVYMPSVVPNLRQNQFLSSNSASKFGIGYFLRFHLLKIIIRVFYCAPVSHQGQGTPAMPPSASTRRLIQKVHKSQKKHDLILPKIAIVRLVRDYLQTNYRRSSFRVQSTACQPIHVALEALLLELFYAAGEIMVSSNRMTLRRLDIERASFIGKYTKGILYARSRPTNNPWLPTTNLLKISENALRRITTRAGILRVSSDSLYLVLEFIDRFINNTIKKTMALVQQSRLKTIRKHEVLRGLKEAGNITVYD